MAYRRYMSRVFTWSSRHEHGSEQRSYATPDIGGPSRGDTMRRSRIAGLVLAAGLVISACGGDSGDEPVRVPPPPDTPKIGVEATSSPDGKDFKLAVPASMQPGVNEITLVNDTKEPTELQFLLFTEGHTLAEFLPIIEKEGAPIPDWVTTGGGVGDVNPGQSRTVVLTLKPGTYSYFSTLSPDTEGATKQYKRGAQGTFEVTGDATGATVPGTQAKVSMREYTFDSAGLKAGDNTVTVENIGGQFHHWVSVKVTNKDAPWADVVKFLQSENPKGTPPVDFKSFSATAVIGSQTSQVDTVKLDAGRYAFLCFITDRQGGPPHALRPGDPMITEVTIPS